MEKKSKTPWPTKAVMEQIYNMHLWGGHTFDFYSGEGSHEPKITNPYIEAVSTFLKSHKKPLVVCDLGCGDFNIGKQLTKYTKKYIAVDIVENLIERNKTYFKNDNLEFLCLDASKNKLPMADVVILRQVLQHLSNKEIQEITSKLKQYKFIILTEHTPLNNFKPNLDIISGQGNRTKINSGVDILQAPFNFKIIEQKTLNNYILENNKGCIITKLYQVF